ncbi:MAG: D-2-hydroxyacid dehydrogenase [Longimicrobiales bacterium]
MRRAVLNLADDRNIWRIPESATEAIRLAFPAGWEVAVVQDAVDGRGDGGGVSAAALSAIKGAEVYLGFGLPRELFLTAVCEEGSQLRWAHTATAGIGSLLYPEMVQSNVILTNSAGVHGPAMAETVLAMVLHFARGLDVAVRAQARREWSASRFEEEFGIGREISGATLGIVGLGGVGREIAWRGRAVGMNVVALRRNAGGSEDGVELITGDDALRTLLARSDYVVISVPSTRETRGMIGARELAAMRADAVLVNVARGEVVDEDALVEVLRAGRLRGAALDVFRTEPLPAESPLWDLPNVLILPHVSGTTDRFWSREAALIVDNVRRYLGVEPLRNVVDKAIGY